MWLEATSLIGTVVSSYTNRATPRNWPAPHPPCSWGRLLLDTNWQFHGQFCFHRAEAASRTSISIFDSSVERASSSMERHSYHPADNIWPLSLINGRHRISECGVTRPTKLSADIKIRQLVCLATQAATNITSFLHTKFGARAPPWLRAACKMGSDSPRGHVSSSPWAGLSTAAMFHWNFPTRSPGEAGREGGRETPPQSQSSPAEEARPWLACSHSAFLQDRLFRAGTE